MVAKSKAQTASDKASDTKSSGTKAAKSKSTKGASSRSTSGSTAAKKTVAKKTARKTTTRKPPEQTVENTASTPDLFEMNADQAAKEVSQETSSAKETPVPASEQSAVADVGSRNHDQDKAALAEQESVGVDMDVAAILKGRGVANAQNIWQPNASIPTLDEATYAAQKAQAEGQRRAIEVAKLNLKNINDLQALERQNIDVAIGAKTNEIRGAQLSGVEIDYQTQLEMNGEKSQQLNQAAARREAATRETGYMQQLISLKDQIFELDVQQAQAAFSEKAARYRAQLTGD